MKALAAFILLIGHLCLTTSGFDIGVRTSGDGDEITLHTGGMGNGEAEPEGGGGGKGWASPMVNVFNMIKSCCGGKSSREKGGDDDDDHTRKPLPQGSMEPWILLAGGAFERLSYTDMELYSLDPKNYPVPKCLKKLRKFPGRTITGFAGGSLTEKMIPTACGSDRYCYTYNAMYDMWMSAGRIKQRRKYPSYSCHDLDGLVMVGGGDSFHDRQDTVSSTVDGKMIATNFENIPQVLMDQCQVTVADEVVVLGGQYAMSNGNCSYSPMTSKGIFVLNLATGKWTHSTVELPMARQLHSCGVVSDDKGMPKEIVVAGGDDGKSGVMDTDILDLKTMAWRKGKKMPSVITGGTVVQLGNSFAIMGGLGGTELKDDDFLDTVYVFDPMSDEFKMLPEKLMNGRYGFSAFPVKMNSFPECH